jgi:hypothetical protein
MRGAEQVKSYGVANLLGHPGPNGRLDRKMKLTWIKLLNSGDKAIPARLLLHLRRWESDAGNDNLTLFPVSLPLGDLVANVFPRLVVDVPAKVPLLQFILQLAFARRIVNECWGGSNRCTYVASRPSFCISAFKSLRCSSLTRYRWRIVLLCSSHCCSLGREVIVVRGGKQMNESNSLTEKMVAVSEA